MNFHYEFILKTIHSGNTTWLGLMTQSYWYQQHTRILGQAKKVRADLVEKTAALGDLKDMEERERLEEALKNSVNAAKKKAQQAMEQWKNMHQGPAFALQWVKYKEGKKLLEDLAASNTEVASLENFQGTVTPLLSVLQDTGFLEGEALTELGVLATELNEGNPLLMSMGYTKGLLATLSGEEIVAFLCAFLTEGKEEGPQLKSLKIPSTVCSALYELDSFVDVFMGAEKKHGVVSPYGYWSLNSYWIEPVWRWLGGEGVSTICDDYVLYDGNFMRVVLKVANLLEELTAMATHTKDVETLAKLEGLQGKLVRDVAVPESLYLRI